ncbi:MAG: hypothetical protein ACREOO_22620 [bacterium]
MPTLPKTMISLYALLFVLIIVFLGVEEWRRSERYANSPQEFEKRYNYVIVFVPWLNCFYSGQQMAIYCALWIGLRLAYLSKQIRAENAK